MSEVYYIDLFCGAGGTSTGIHFAGGKVLACVNHDKDAISSHKANHPEAVHFLEDIRDLRVIEKIRLLVERFRKENPNASINLWGSLECTNFSKAKGGLPRDPDSRSLADYMDLYIEAIKPDYFWVENVREFMAWGPLDDKGKPLSKDNGIHFQEWIKKIKSLGYNCEWRLLNSADFGAYTSRERLFIQFAKHGHKITWPMQTHTKKAMSNLSIAGRELKPWKPVKEVLNLDNQGISIFNRKKPLVDRTLERIYAGLVKFVANGEDNFLAKYFSGRPEGKVISIKQPAGAIKTIDGHSLVSANFLQSYYGNGGVHSVDAPSPTVTTVDKLAKVQYLMMKYSNSPTRSLFQPAATVTNVDKHNLTTSFILNPSFGCKGHSIEQPSPVVIARQDKKPLSLIQCTLGEGFLIPVYEDDTEIMIKIKTFMAHFGIVDIKQRMLEVDELKKIQGFPDDYVLMSSSTNQKKFIGNSVEVNTAKAIISKNIETIKENYLLKMAI